MGLPNFLVIGAGRAGTTSIHHYLQEHPQVFVPSVKSPSHFFCQDLKPIKDETVRVVRLRDSVFQFFTRNLEKQSMPRELRARLTDLYRPDIERLQEMCGRDLSDWLQRP